MSSSLVNFDLKYFHTVLADHCNSGPGHFSGIYFCEWMQGDVGQLLELVRSFFGHSREL